MVFPPSAPSRSFPPPLLLKSTLFSLSLSFSLEIRHLKNTQIQQNKIQDEVKSIILEVDMATQQKKRHPQSRHKCQIPILLSQESHKSSKLVARAYMQRT